MVIVFVSCQSEKSNLYRVLTAKHLSVTVRAEHQIRERVANNYLHIKGQGNFASYRCLRRRAQLIVVRSVSSV